MGLGFLHIATHNDRWTAPTARYAVHRSGVAPEYFKRLSEAKAFIVAEHGPQKKWERREVPNGRTTRIEWWPR